MDNLTREHMILVGAAFKKLAYFMKYEPEVVFEEYNSGRSFEHDSVRVIFGLHGERVSSTGARRGLMEIGREFVDFLDTTTVASHIMNQLLIGSSFVSREFQVPGYLRYLEKVDQYGTKRF